MNYWIRVVCDRCDSDVNARQIIINHTTPNTDEGFSSEFYLKLNIHTLTYSLWIFLCLIKSTKLKLPFCFVASILHVVLCFFCLLYPYNSICAFCVCWMFVYVCVCVYVWVLCGFSFTYIVVLLYTIFFLFFSSYNVHA